MPTPHHDVSSCGDITHLSATQAKACLVIPDLSWEPFSPTCDCYPACTGIALSSVSVKSQVLRL